MGALSSKLRSVQGGQVMFHCPGCNSPHVVRVDPAFGSAWGYNGNPEAPTFTPSILVTWPANPSAEAAFEVWRTERRCHSFVNDGRIEFLGDSTHELAGKTVDIPDWPKPEGYEE